MQKLRDVDFVAGFHDMVIRKRRMIRKVASHAAGSGALLHRRGTRLRAASMAQVRTEAATMASFDTTETGPTMAVKPPYPHADFLAHLTQVSESGAPSSAPTPSPALAQMLFVDGKPSALTPAGKHLIALLTAQKATQQAAFDTALVADELRRYQKFAKPGQPSPHIVQLRHQQSSVRVAGSLAKQSYIKSAAAFVRDAGITVPEKVALELYITRWIGINLPKDAVAA